MKDDENLNDYSDGSGYPSEGTPVTLKSATQGCLVAILCLLSIPGFFILAIFLAGHITLSTNMCDEMKFIEIDFDNKELNGIYSYEVKPFLTNLSLSDDLAYGCVDNNTDNLADQCNDYGEFINPKKMTGTWKIINKVKYPQPYGIHINGGGKTNYVGLKQGNVTVYVPLFTLDEFYPPASNVSTISRGSLDNVRPILCEKFFLDSIPDGTEFR